MRNIALVFTLCLGASVFATPTISKIDPAVGFTYGGTRVTISGTGFGTASVDCPIPPPGGTGQGTCPAEVWFGEVKGMVTRVTPTAIRAIALPTASGAEREAGVVDVRVRVEGEGEVTAPNAFRFDPAAVPSGENYIGVMIPLNTITETPGANGSIWRADLVAYNASGAPLRPVGVFCPLANPIGCDFVIPPRGTQNVFLAPSMTDGAFLYLPRPLAESTHLSLRARDISRNATSWGAAVPVVMPDEFESQVTLIDIPTDDRYRATLRIYSASMAPQQVRMRIFSETDPDHAVRDEVVELEGMVTILPVEFPAGPAYAQLDPLAAGVRASGPRLRIEVSNMGENVSPPPPPLWAFVTITHNETQQVTVITPK